MENQNVYLDKIAEAAFCDELEKLGKPNLKEIWKTVKKPLSAIGTSFKKTVGGIRKSETAKTLGPGLKLKEKAKTIGSSVSLDLSKAKSNIKQMIPAIATTGTRLAAIGSTGAYIGTRKKS